MTKLIDLNKIIKKFKETNSKEPEFFMKFKWISTDLELPNEYRPVVISKMGTGLAIGYRFEKNWYVNGSIVENHHVRYWFPTPEISDEMLLSFFIIMSDEYILN